MRPYVLMLYVGCVAGVLAGTTFAERSGLPPSRFALTATLHLAPALVGARLWYVAQHPDEFRGQLARIWRRGEGGSSLYGGLVLGVAASFPALWVAGLPFLRFWDAASITMLVGLILARVGCQLNGCCAGRETSGPLGVRLPDHRGRWRRRYPTQLLEAAWAVIIGVVTLAIGTDRPAGAVFAGVVAAYAAGRLVLEPLREHADPMRERRVNVVFSAALAVVGIGGLIAALT